MASKNPNNKIEQNQSFKYPFISIMYWNNIDRQGLDGRLNVIHIWIKEQFSFCRIIYWISYWQSHWKLWFIFIYILVRNKIISLQNEEISFNTSIIIYLYQDKTLTIKFHLWISRFKTYKRRLTLPSHSLIHYFYYHVRHHCIIIIT